MLGRSHGSQVFRDYIGAVQIVSDKVNEIQTGHSI